MRSIPRPHQAPPDTHLIALPGTTESPTPRSPSLTPPPTTPLTARLSPVPTLCVLQSLMSLFPQFPASNSAKHTRHPQNAHTTRKTHTPSAKRIRHLQNARGAGATQQGRQSPRRHTEPVNPSLAAGPPPARSQITGNLFNNPHLLGLAQFKGYAILTSRSYGSEARRS